MAWPILLAACNAAQGHAQQGHSDVPATVTIGEFTMENKKRACWRQIQRKLKQEYDAASPQTTEAQRRDVAIVQVKKWLLAAFHSGPKAPEIQHLKFDI